MFVADTGEHGGDMPVLPVERLTALRIVPGQGRNRRRSKVDTDFLSLADPSPAP